MLSLLQASQHHSCYHMLTPLQSDAIPHQELLCSSGRQWEHRNHCNNSQIEFSLLQKRMKKYKDLFLQHCDGTECNSYVQPFLCRTGMYPLLRNSPKRAEYNSGEGYLEKRNRLIDNKYLFIKTRAKGREEKLKEHTYLWPIINNPSNWKAIPSQTFGSLTLREGQSGAILQCIKALSLCPLGFAHHCLAMPSLLTHR